MVEDIEGIDAELEFDGLRNGSVLFNRDVRIGEAVLTARVQSGLQVRQTIRILIAV